MSGFMRLSGRQQVQLPSWLYISGVTYTNPNSQAVTIPSTATIVEIDAEDAECYYEINSASANANSYGYVPSEGGRIIGPLANMTSLYVHGTSSIVHIQFFREA